MKSYRYCPNCKSFDIRRTKRGFIRRVLLRVPPLYKCEKCGITFSSKEMHENKRVDDPHSTLYDKEE